MFIFALFFVFAFVLGGRVESKIKQTEEKVFHIKSFRDFESFYSDPKGDRLLLVVVGESLKSQCPYCEMFKEQFFLLSKHYYDDYSSKFLWGIFEYEDTDEKRQIAMKLEINSVPSVLFYKKSESKYGSCSLQSELLFDCVKNQMGYNPPEKVKAFIDEQKNQMRGGGGGGGRQYRQRVPNFSANFFLFVLVFAPIFLCLLYFVFEGMGNWKRFLMYVCCVFSFIVCVGCIVYNMITNPGYGYGKSIIYPQQRAQMKWEGYVAAFLIIVFSLAWISLMDFIPKPSRFNLSEHFGEKAGLLSLIFSRTKKFLSYLLVAIIFSCFILVLNMYITKYEWYLVDVPYFFAFVNIIHNLPIGRVFEWFS